MKGLKWKAAALMTAGLLMTGGMEAMAAHLEDIESRGTIRVGTTGDYRPRSYEDNETGA